MAKLSTKKISQTQRVLLFGPPKVGKSKLAGALAEYYDLLWFDLENGHDVLFQFPTEWQDRIELIDIPDTRSFPIAIETCMKVVKGPVSICEVHGKVTCMICKRAQKDADTDEGFFIDVDLNNLGSNKIAVFDSSTQLTNSAIAFITKSQPDDYKLTYDDWGNLGKLMDIFFSHIQQAGYNVIVISHETEAVTEGKKTKLVPVGGTRNFSRNVAKYFDHVVYMEVVNKKHRAISQTTSSTSILTGSRTGAVLDGMEEPSLLPIFKPELFPDEPKTKPTITSGGQANKILARLKSK